MTVIRTLVLMIKTPIKLIRTPAAATITIETVAAAATRMTILDTKSNLTMLVLISSRYKD